MSCRACGAVAYAVVDGAERCRACVAIDAVRAEGFAAGVAAERARCVAMRNNEDQPAFAGDPPRVLCPPTDSCLACLWFRAVAEGWTVEQHVEKADATRTKWLADDIEARAALNGGWH